MIKLEDKTMTKKIYNQPEVQVAQVALDSMILAGSPAGAPTVPVNTGIPTDDQW